jgi:hypothetical protein
MGRNRGRTYELKARFTAEADVRDLESLEKRLTALGRKVDSLNRKSAKIKVGDSGLDDLSGRAETLQERVDKLTEDDHEVTLKENRREADKLEKRLAGLHKSTQRLADDEWELQFNDNSRAIETNIKRMEKMAKGFADKAWNIEFTARERGLDDIARKARDTRMEVEQLARSKATVVAEMKGERELNAKIDSLERNLQELTRRPWEAEVQGDVTQASMAFRQLAAQARAQFSRAYVAEVKAESEGFPEVAAQAANLKRELLQLSQSRARVAVELDGVPQVLAGLVTVKRAASGVEGEYRISLDYSKITAALNPMNALNTASRALRGSIGALGSVFMNSTNSMMMLSRAVFATQQAFMAFAMAGIAVVIAALGPLVAGLTIVIGALGMLAGGLGLIAGVAGPVISALGNVSDSTEKAATASNTLRNANNALEQANMGVAKAHQQVATTARQNEKAISSAISAHADAVRGVEAARRSYDDAVRGVAEAEVRGEEQVINAIEQHNMAIRNVGDAQNAVGKAAIAVTDAQVAAQDRLQQATRAHEMAMRGVSTAQHDYSMAQRAATDAQRELTFATEDYNDALATEQQRLLGLNYDLEGLQLNQKQLALDMQEAQQTMGSAATPLEAQQAALRLEELQLRQKENTLAIEEAQTRLSEAQTEGTDELQSAYEGQRSAINGVTDSQYALGQASLGVQDAQYELGQAAQDVTRAQQDGNRGVAEAVEAYHMAQRDLNDAIYEEQKAQMGVGKARSEAAKGVEEAQRRVFEASLGVEDAMRREQEAAEGISEAQITAQENMANALQGVDEAYRRQQDALAGVAEAQRKFNEAMADIPEASILALHAAGKALWDSWLEGTQEGRTALIDFATNVISLSNEAMPHLTAAANSTIQSMIQGFYAVMQAWGDHGVFTSLQTVLEGIAPVTQALGEGLGYILGGLFNVLAEMQPYILEFAFYIRDIGQRFLAWTDSEQGRYRINQFFQAAAPVAAALWKWITLIGGTLLLWSIEHPQEVVMVIDALGTVAWGALMAIGWMVKALIGIHQAVPWLLPVVGALMGIGFVLLLIPKPLRQIIGWLVRLAFGFTVAGTAGAGMGATVMAVMTRLGFIMMALGGIFLIFNGIATGSMWQIAIGAGMVAFAITRSFWVAIPLAAGVFFILSGVANESFLMIAIGVGLLTFAFTRNLPLAVLMSLGSFFALSGGGISALDIMAMAVAAFALFMPRTFWAAVMWIGRVAIMGFLVPVFAAAFSAIAAIVVAGAAALGVPVWAFVLGVIAAIGIMAYSFLTIFDHIFNYLSPMFFGLWQMWNDGTISGGEFMIAIVRGVAAAIFSIFMTIGTAIPRLLFGALSYIPGPIGDFFGSINDKIVSGISTMRDTIAGQTANIGLEIGRNLGYGAEQGMGTVSRMADGIGSTLGGLYNSAKSAMGGLSSNIIGTTGMAEQGATQNMQGLASGAMGSLSGLAQGGQQQMGALENSIVGDTYGGYQQGSQNLAALNQATQQNLMQANQVGSGEMYDLANTGIYGNTYAGWGYGADNTAGLANDAGYNLAGLNTTGYNEMASLANQGIYDNTYAGWGYGADNTYGLWNDGAYNLGGLNTTGYNEMYDMAEYGIGANTATGAGYGIGNMETLNTEGSAQAGYFEDDASASTAELGRNMANNVWTAVGNMLYYLATDLVNGLSTLNDSLGLNLAITAASPALGAALTLSSFWFKDGGTMMARGGMGTPGKNPQHITWNEQAGNEAWIAQKGPKQANLGYLHEAASWYNMRVVDPDRPIGIPGVTGEGDGLTHYGFSSEVQGYVDEIESMFSTVANTYGGHGELGGSSESMSADFWSAGGRGIPIDIATGDAITGHILSNMASNLAYIIWNGIYYSGGQQFPWPEDPHTDHVHASWGPGGWGSGFTRGALAAAIASYIPQPPDVGDGTIASMVEGVGRKGYDAVVSKVMSLARSGTSGMVDISGASGSNLEMGQQLAEQLGWTGSEWTALQELWTRESGWDHNAVNPDSGAYGIPQILPSAHGYPVPTDDPAAQIAWGLQYIMERYGSPSAALAFHDANNWYAKGGVKYMQAGGTMGGSDPSDPSTYWSDDPMTEVMMSEPAGANSRHIANMFSPPAQKFAYEFPEGGRNYFIDTETPDNSAFFFGPNGEGIGYYYGDDAVLAAAAAAQSQPNFSYWQFKNDSSYPFFDQYPPPEGPTDKLKVVWAGALDNMATQMANQMPTTPTSMPTAPTTQPGYTTAPGYGAAGGTGYTGGPYAQAGNVVATGGQTATNSSVLSVKIVNGQVVEQSGTGQPGAMANRPTGMTPGAYGAQGYGNTGMQQPGMMGQQPMMGQQQMGMMPQQQQYTPYGSAGPTAPGMMGQTTQSGGDLDSWVSQGIAMGGVFQDDPATHQALVDRAMQESGGDPYAINDWDSNAMAGTPSKGLMQIIQPTWDAWTDAMIGYFEENWMDPVKSVAVATRYMSGEYGGPVGYTGYGYKRGGLGTNSRNPQHITWNEGAGNEAWISTGGDRNQNVGYLKKAASWFNMGVVPMKHGGFVSGVGEALGPTHYGWSPEVQGYVDYLSQFGAEANTYVGHGEPGGSTEDMTADFWGYGGRGVPIDPAVGEQIAQAALAAGGLAYMIWNGNYYGSDGSVTPWPEDPHYDHVHISWAGGAQMGAAPATGAVDPATGMPYAPATGYADPYATGYADPYATGYADPAMSGYADPSMMASYPTTGAAPSGTGGMYQPSGTTPMSGNYPVGGTGTPMGSSSGSSQVNPQFTANTTNQQSGSGQQSVTSGAITQTYNGQAMGGGTGAMSPEMQQMAGDVGTMANDTTQGMPGMATGMDQMGTEMGTGMSGLDSGIGTMNQDMNQGFDQLNNTMGSCMGQAPMGTANPAIGGVNGYGAGGTSPTATNSATNTAVDSYSDWQNTGQTQGPGANIIMGGQSRAMQPASAAGAPSPDAQYLGDKMDQLSNDTWGANEETEIGKDSLQQMINGAVESAFGAIGSKRGRDMIDQGQADKMNFDRLMSGL